MNEAQRFFEQAQSLRDSGDIESAIGCYGRSRSMAMTEGDRMLAAHCLHQQGVAFYIDGNFPDAERFMEDALGEFGLLRKKVFTGAVMRDRGLAAFSRSEYQSRGVLGFADEAEDWLEKSIEILGSPDDQETDNRGHLGMSQVKLGVVHAASLGEDDDYTEALDLIEEGIGNIKKSPDKFFLSTAYFDLAEVLELAGEYNGAKDALMKSLKVLDSIEGKGPHDFLDRRRKIDEFLAILDTDLY